MDTLCLAGAPMSARPDTLASHVRALRAALKWRNRNPDAPWSIMFFDVLRKQDNAGKVGMRRLEHLADVLFDCAMDPRSPYPDDREFAESNRGDE